MSQRQAFDVITLSPAAWSHPGVAVSAARAGGVGVIDLEFGTDRALAAAHFARLVAESVHGEIGLRVVPEIEDLAVEIIAAAPADRPLVLIAGGPGAAAIKLARALRKARGRVNEADRLYLEVTDADTKLGQLKPDGIIAKGFEAPGWGGEDSSYVLVQKWLARTQLPVLVRGGVGQHAAAALRAAGAAGVVLDDQVLLCDEAPLSAELKTELARLNGSETRSLGELLGAPCRVYARPGSESLETAQNMLREAEAGKIAPEEWRNRLAARVGWGEGRLRPVGQGVGVGAGMGHKRVARVIKAIRKQSFASLRIAAQQRHLAEGAPLAVSHGTRYPLVQGPMTRVSDNAQFAADVAEAGGLPFLALALMRGEQVDELLAETAARVGDRPWGVGMLGFVPQALRDEQCEAIWKHKPPFALIAGGRPDQAQQFESRGIPAYIHVPAPQLLKMYYEQGARRFVFEGRECGGHIGPIASFPLWEQMIAALLEAVDEKTAPEVHVLFAGGISDDVSGAMLAALTAPLAERGIRVGGLMGTAYLFTKEIVASGAVVQGYQDEALACRHTTSLETGPGHSTRCVDTAFAREFFDKRRELLAAGQPAEEIRDTLEDLNLGRLRLASKGRMRNDAGEIITIDAGQQKRDGMYMIGQVATMRDQVVTCAELHENVSTRGTQRLLELESDVEARREAASPSDVAVVGIGMVLPGAGDADSFWHNVVEKVSIIREVPRERWDWRLYFDPDMNARDKVYSKWGGFLDEITFDPLRFGIPPRSMKSIDPMQLLSLECTARALDDAGFDDDFDRENTSVILGAGGGVGDLGMQYGVRAELPRFVELPDDGAWERLPEWTNESFAGVLQNVAAGRVANRMDFGGLNFTVDAACGSSLAAVTLATQELEAGRSNIAIAGGVDTVQGPHGFLCFSKTQALSPKGIPRTFDKNADGIAISEGVAMVVLKRLADAEADGDRIYAVIKGAAGSSDGKALGMTAPRPEGQIRALDRVYRKAGFGQETVELVEAHGTGTPVGDRAEAETITRSWRDNGAPAKSVALGSIKTILGHTKCAAGVSGLIKVALSLHHRVLPAHVGVEDPIDAIAAEDSPAYLLDEPRPWLRSADHPRRGAVSAFGFGGTNFHAVLEEYRGSYAVAEPVGARRWPWELFVFRAADAAALQAQVEKLNAALAAGDALGIAEIAHTLAAEAEQVPEASCVAAFVADSHDTLRKQVEGLRAHLAENKALPPGVRCNLHRRPRRRVGLLFPGQGAQSVGMGREVALYHAELREALERADEVLGDKLQRPLSSLMWPEAAFSDAAREAQQQAITDTRHAQPAIGALSLGYLDLLRRLGVTPEAVAGHSYGEYTALHAAGVIDREAFLRLSAARGAAMADAAGDSVGAMAAVQASREQVDALLADAGRVWVANHNAPEQVVISGAADAVDAVIDKAKQQQIRATKLPVSGAFHTELVAAAQQPLSAAIDATDFNAPQCKVYGNHGGAHSDDAAAIAEQLKGHLLAPVEFVSELQAMAADGVDCFIECGPKAICAGMARATLAEHDAAVVSLDGQGGGLRGLLNAVGELLCAGVDVPVTRLMVDRGIARHSLAALPGLLKPAEIPATAFYLSGGCARPKDDPERRTGSEAPLTLERQQAARERAKAATAAPAPAPPAAAGAQSPAAQQPQVPAMPAAAAAAGISGFGQEALAAYQRTMQQFLHLQEQVMSRVLGGLPAQPAAGQPAMPAPTAASMAPQQPTVAATPQAAAAQPQAAEAPATPAPSAPAEPAAPAFDAKAALLALVADRTGYPEDMIGLEADLEADLGIDSIKRVEIVGAFAKEAPTAIAEAMQADMERFTGARSLSALLAELPETASAPAVATSGPAASAPPADFDAKSALLALVADRTGYPEDMIGLDADLEADLGIDSIKRVEIVGAFAREAPTAIANAMQADMERFTGARSLSALLAELAAVDTADASPAGAAAKPPVAAALESAPAAAEAGSDSVARYVIRPRQIAPVQHSVALSGHLLILGEAEDGPHARALRIRAEPAGLTPVCIDADDEAGIGERLAALEGPIAGVVLLHGLQPAPTDELDAQLEAGRRAVSAAFASLRAFGEQVAGLRLVAATRLGGTLGRDAVSNGAPVAGGVVGLLNCARQEFPEAHLRPVDFNGQTPDSIAHLLLAELGSTEQLPEVGYVGDARYTSATVAEPLQDTRFAPHLEPQGDWVVLATGGARGITASILRKLARPGMTMVLAGRSARPEPESAELAAAGDEAALKKLLLEQARARGETPKPAEIDRAVARVLADREIRAALDGLEAAGVTVDYRAVDVRDSAAVQALVDDVHERYGRLDAVLHGAGIIEDKLLADKTPESFERVFSTKVDSAIALAGALRPESLKLLVFFTSVAGRYGNRGQSDYAAANEALNRLAWQLSRRWKQTRVVSLNWGPWDAGMATEAVKQAFRSRGVVPIPLDAGCDYFLQEISYGPRHEVEVVVGEGPWNAAEGGVPADARPAPGSALLRGELRMGSGGALELEQTISLESDPWLSDHQLDGIAVVPATAAAEWLAAVAEAGWPGWQLHELRDLRVLSGIRLEDNQPKRILLRARASSHSDAGGQIVKLEILDPENKNRTCYRANAHIVERLPEAPELPADIVALGADAQARPADAAYAEWLFHGPRFQRMHGELQLAPQGVDAALAASHPDELGLSGAGWILDPALLDCLPQLAWVWSRYRHDTSALPTAVGCIRRYAGALPDEGLRVLWRARSDSSAEYTHYDAWIVDGNGRVRLAFENAESNASKALNRLAGA